MRGDDLNQKESWLEVKLSEAAATASFNGK